MKGSMKRFFKVNGKILLVIVVLILVLVGFAMLNINIPSGDAFELNHVVSMEASEYSKNGSDWGHNQN
jgi:PDZ domain-containing secreted protein